MANSKKGYLNYGLKDIINLVLAIIPFTSWILGAITRIMRGHLIAGVLQLITPVAVVFWVLDIYTMATKNDLTYFA